MTTRRIGVKFAAIGPIKIKTAKSWGENRKFFADLSCVYTSQVRTCDHPSRDHGYGSDAGPAFTRIRARKYITTCNHCATLFTRPFCSHVCFVKMPALWEESEVLFLLEIRGDQEIQKQYYECSMYTRSRTHARSLEQVRAFMSVISADNSEIFVFLLRVV